MRDLVLSGCLLFASLLPVTALSADAPKPITPASLEGATVVDAKKAEELVKGGKVKVYDVRKKLEFAEEHIPGAEFLPYDEKSEKKVDYDATADKFETEKLPSDKSAGVMFYCNGPDCWKSMKSCKAAIKAGHKKVYWFRGGLPEWKKAGHATEK